jgi:hypothetical protein
MNDIINMSSDTFYYYHGPNEFPFIPSLRTRMESYLIPEKSCGPESCDDIDYYMDMIMTHTGVDRCTAFNSFMDNDENIVDTIISLQEQ